MREYSQHNGGNTTFVIHLNDGDYDISLTFTEDELYTLWYAEEGMPKTVICPTNVVLQLVMFVDTQGGAYFFLSEAEDKHTSVKMTITSGKTSSQNFV